jgi:hypothetical protein
MQFQRIWRGDIIDCQYCKNGTFPHEHKQVRRRTRRAYKAVDAPPRNVQQMIEFGDRGPDCE